MHVFTDIWNVILVAKHANCIMTPCGRPSANCPARTRRCICDSEQLIQPASSLRSFDKYILQFRQIFLVIQTNTESVSVTQSSQSSLPFGKNSPVFFWELSSNVHLAICCIQSTTSFGNCPPRCLIWKRSKKDNRSIMPLSILLVSLPSNMWGHCVVHQGAKCHIVGRLLGRLWL